MDYIAKAIKVSAFLAFAAAALIMHWDETWAVLSFIIAIILL